MSLFFHHGRQARVARAWLSLFLGMGLVAGSCKARAKKSAAEVPLGPVNTEAHVELQQDGDKVAVSVEPLPAETSSVHCSINDAPPVDCRNGLVIQNLKEGRYTLVVTFVAAGKTLEEVREFAVQGGKVTEGTSSTGSVGKEDIRFILTLGGVSKGWQNNEAVPRSMPLSFEFDLDSNQACVAQILCSFEAEVWALCDFENRPRLELDPREINEGFQKVSVKAMCDQPKIETKLVELSWFGVADGYQPLSLTKRTIGSVAHYQLAKQNDCLGELTFECAESGQPAFKSCRNVRENPPSGFQIRAVCAIGAAVTTGPILTQ